MRIFNYDATSKLLTGESFADPDQVVPGGWIYPAFCTTVAPPAVIPPDQAAQFNPDTNTWSLVLVAPFLTEEGQEVVETDEERANREMTDAINKRQLMLRETDWVVLRAYERSEPVPNNWAEYREAIRQIDHDPAWPHVTWPTLAIIPNPPVIEPDPAP